jgi:hypothetical protein
VEHSQKVFLALCVLVAVFLSTNLMLVPLLRRPRENRRSSTGKALGGLFKIGGGAPNEAMEELNRRVENLKQESAPGEKDQD